MVWSKKTNHRDTSVCRATGYFRLVPVHQKDSVMKIHERRLSHRSSQLRQLFNVSKVCMSVIRPSKFGSESNGCICELALEILNFESRSAMGRNYKVGQETTETSNGWMEPRLHNLS